MDVRTRTQAYTFSTWNVRWLTEKKRETFAEIERENEDLIVLTETKLRGTGQEEYGNYIHLYSGVKTGPSRAGVSILLKKGLGRVIKWEAISERIITAKLSISGQKIIVIGVYGTDETAKPTVKDAFQEDLKNVLKKIKKQHELIMLGDFNSKVGVSKISKVVGNFGNSEVNTNGRRLIDLCEEYHLKIQNTFFDHEDIHKYTWYHKWNLSKSLIDFCITRQDTSLYVHDVLACRWLECGTDHVFLEATISFPLLINDEIVRVELEDVPETRRYKTYMLYSKTIRTSYEEYLESIIDMSVKRTTKEIYQHLKESIHLAASKTLGIQDKDLFGEFLWDKELKELRSKRIERYKNEKQEHINEQLNPDKTTFDVEFDKIKNEVWEGICAAIDNTKKSKSNAWNIIYDLLNKTNENLVDPQLSDEFYKSLFKNNRLSVKEFQAEMQECKQNLYEINPDMTIDVNIADVSKALDDLDDDKYPTPGGLSIQLLRCSRHKTKRLLTNLIQGIFNGDEIPTEINETYISDVSMCSIIPSQNLLDTTFLFRLLLQKNAEKRNGPFHFALIDLRQAFFGIEHKKLFSVLEKYGVSKPLLGVMEHLYKLNTIRIVTSDKLSKIFSLSKGLIEQCILAPTLFKMYVQQSIMKWMKKNLQNGITIDNRILSYIIHNDKLIIFAGNHKTLETMILSLRQSFRNLNLHISLKSIKYLGNEKLTLGKTEIKGEETLNLEGSILELDGRNVEDVWDRVLEAKRVIGFLHPVVRDESIARYNKKRIFNLIIRRILTEGCETWTLTDDLKEALNNVEMSYGGLEKIS
ncbi:craniofacial development protein 2 [Trichonephila inaurata madagascariensis]|uniref:Craniofacial development protein 2 n=1 Tax=Trichonephila inaurata madagascariensis TaxID=2747483 RepID=A0A8X6IJJ2_9ARAC|nr:craniofacial development protein 2 [Trichonephila inaurata madagascariensis]